METLKQTVDALLEGTGDVGAVTTAPRVNRQLYSNSPLSGSDVEQDYENNPDALFNSKEPNLAVKHEKPEHRIVLFLKAQGLSNREISERTGYTQPWISQLLRQPWARERLIKEISSQGRDAVSEVIKAAAEDSVWTLIDVRDTAPRPSDKLAAANSLLDRFLGKPTQKVEQTLKELPADPAALQKELELLRQEESRLRGISTN